MGNFKDYWEFEAIARSFRDTGFGKIKQYGPLKWRVRGGDHVLLTPPKRLFRVPIEANRKRIRSMTWCNSIGKNVPIKKSGYCAIMLPDWEPDNIPICRRVLNKGFSEGIERVKCTDEQLASITQVWLTDKKAKRPHDMLRKGHHRQMISDPGMEFWGYTLGDEFIGAVGVAIEDDEAALGFLKHSYHPWWVSKYIWIESLVSLYNRGVTTVNAGDTSKLKKSIGLTNFPQYRVDFSNLP